MSVKVSSRADISAWTAAAALLAQLAFFYNATATEAWGYDQEATDAASDGFVIVPSDSPPQGRWIRQPDYVATALALNDVAANPPAVPPGSIGHDQLTPDIIQELANATQRLIGGQNSIIASIQNMVDAAIAAGGQAKTTQRTLTAQVGSARADYVKKIAVIATNIEALAVVVEGVSAQIGNVWAQGLIRIQAEVTPTGFDSYVQISAAGSLGGPTVPAAMFIGVKTVGGVPLSYIDYIADQIRWLDTLGNRLALLTADGFIVGDRVLPGTISSGSTYSLVGGTLALSAPDSTAPPADGPETDVPSGQSIFAYDDTMAIDGFEADPTAQIFDVEGYFYFRVQSGAGAVSKAGIEYYDGTWNYLPGSVTAVQTNNTDSMATLEPKGSIPYGATRWRPRLYNTTGNTIHAREARGTVSNFLK